MQNLEAPVELDFKETNEEWEGKWLTEGAYDSIVHTKDYEYGVNIFSPASSFDPVPIATVIPNVYENRDHLVDTLNNINETSTMRANAAGPIDHDEMKAKGMERPRMPDWAVEARFYESLRSFSGPFPATLADARAQVSF